MSIGFLGRLDNFLQACIGFPVSDVFQYRSCKQVNILLDNTNISPQRTKPNVSYIDSVQKHFTVTDIIKPGNQRTQRGFTHTRRTNQCDILSRLNIERKISQHFVVIFPISEYNIPKLDVSLNSSYIHGVWRIHDFRLNSQDFHEPFKAGDAILELLGNKADSLNGFGKITDIQQ